MSEGSTILAGPAEPTQDEKAYAGLSHALMISTWWIGPVILYLVKRKSQFVAFHSLQALIFQVLFTLLYMGLMAVFFAVMIGTVASMPQGKEAQQAAFPTAFFVLFPLIWLIMMGGFAISLILGIIYAIKAMKGEWADYPLIGRWARRIVGI
jgi:uncharacterized membrane protein